MDAEELERSLRDRYTLEIRLGSGAEGIVWRARQVSMDRSVVLKMVPWASSGDPRARSRFEREARWLATVPHPNLLPVLDFGIEGEAAFLAYPDLGGTSLDRTLESGRLAWERAVEILDGILAGLGHLHSHRIVHRDLKPANVLVAGDGSIRIFDLGLARRAVQDATVTGSISGTPWYMAPEQVRGLPADARDDLYAVGMMAFQMIAGTTPFAADGIEDVLQAQLSAEPRPLVSVVPEVPEELSVLVGELLAKTRDERPRRALEVRQRLPRPRTATSDHRVQPTTPGDGAASGGYVVAGSGGFPAAPARAPWKALPVVVLLVLACLFARVSLQGGPDLTLGARPALQAADPGTRPSLASAATAVTGPGSPGFVGRTRDQLASLTPEDLARLADPAAWGDLERRLSPVAEAMAWLATGHCPPDGLPREQAADFEELDREFVALGLPEVFPAARGLLGRRPPFAGETPTPTPAPAPAPAPAGEPSPSWIGLFRDRLYAAAVETQRLQDSLDRAVESDPVARADDPPGRSPGEERLLARVRGMAVFRAGGRPPIYESLQVIWNLGGPTRSEWVRDGAAGILATRGMLWALGQILRHEPEAAAEALETCLATDFAFRPWLRSTLAFQPPDALLGGPPSNWVGRLARGFLYHETARIPAFPDAGNSTARRSAAMLEWEEGLEAATPSGSFGARLVARSFAAWCQGALVRGDPPGRLAEVYASRVAPRLRDDRLVPPMALSWIPEAVAQGRGAATRLGPLARAILSASPGGLPDTLVTLLGTLATPGEPE